MAEPGLFLTTDRLVLRRFTLDDADELLALDSDPLVRRLMEDGESVTRDKALETIEPWLG
jgi:RimJ/RimL family protein N-acetyltransferase